MIVSRNVSSVMGGFLVASAALAVLGATEARAQFQSDNVNLLSQIPLGGFSGNPQNGSDCWGYVSALGREYALMGLYNSLAVVEITTPTSPVIVDQISHTGSLWADVKVYGDYCYVVNESGGGMDVIDLSDVDNGNVTLVQRVTAGGLATSHNVAIDADSGYLYLCGANINSGRLVAYSLVNPANPVAVGQISDAGSAYVHDAQIVTFAFGPYAGRQIAFCANGGIGLDIYDVTNKSNMFRMSRTTYPNLSYSHQCWLSEDGQYLYLNDELDGVNETVVFNVADLSSPVVVNTYNSGVSATDHNLYVRDGFIYEAEYHAGLRIFCADDPVNPVQVGWFDSYPENDGGGFDGAWSVFPFFPSGTVLISDIDRGLFVVDPTDALNAGTLIFTYPKGRPDLIDPQGGTPLRVAVAGTCGATAEPTTGLLHYDAGKGFSTVPLDEVSKNVYEALFPAIACGQEVPYYVSLDATNGSMFTDPADAPATTFTTVSGNELVVQFDDDFETDTGWVVGAPGDDATTGIWVRVDPNGTAAQPEDDHTPDPGTMCFVTGQGSPGGGVGENDVDGGRTTLTSPLIDLDGVQHAQISYWRWYSNNTGGSPNADVFVVDISNDDGSSWINAETVGPAGVETSGGWFYHAINVADFVAPTALVRLRFIASDEGSGSIVEAAVDDLQVSVLSCQPPCPADLDGDGTIGPADLATLLTCWGTPCGDLNNDGTTDPSDLAILLANWGPCP